MGGVKVRRCGAFSFFPCPFLVFFVVKYSPKSCQQKRRQWGGRQFATCKGKYEKIKRGLTVILLHFGSVAA